MRVLILQHIACEHPGVFSKVLDDQGVERVAVELDAGEPLPDWRRFDAVVAMGGPMSAGDERELSWLIAEKRLIRDAVRARTPFLGVCLGVQLLASALGARVMPDPGGPEVGLLPVDLTSEGERDPLFTGLERPLVVLQWHGDTFELPEDGVLLARSAHTEHQAFRWGDRAYGVQFHVEVTGAMAREWGEVPAYRESLASTLGAEAGERLLFDVAERAPAMGDQARRLFANWLALARPPDGRSPRAGCA